MIGLAPRWSSAPVFLPLRYLGKIYVELVRGTPLLVQILILFYVVADAFGVENRFVVGVLTWPSSVALTYLRSSAPGSRASAARQLESAKAIGLTLPQTYRYVIFPQAVRQCLPPLTGQFVSLIKGSSLLSIIVITNSPTTCQNANASAIA